MKENSNLSHIVDKPVKVDFHIHSVYSSSKDGSIVRDGTIENLDILVKKLNENEINMVSITDHDCLDVELYLKLKEEEGKGTIKKVLPGIEATVMINDSNNEPKPIHIVTIFDDSDIEKIKKASDLFAKKKKNTYFPKYNYENKAFTEEEYWKIIKEIDLNVIVIGHQKNSPTSQKDQRKNDVSTLGKEKMEELIFIDYFDSFEYKNEKNEIFNNRYLKQMEKRLLDVKFIVGSDCHQWKYYPKHDKTSNDENVEFSWIKILPTFKGLVMAMTDYRRIKQEDNFFTLSDNTIKEIDVSINGEEVAIPLSKGINAIIGDNSVGKSMFLHALTNYEYTKKDLKKEYEDYLYENKMEIKTTIPKNKILKFDMQGNIRNTFVNDKAVNDEFLKCFYPAQYNYELDKEILKSAFKELVNIIKLNTEINNSKKSFNNFSIVQETDPFFFYFFAKPKQESEKSIIDLLDKFEKIKNLYKGIKKKIDKEDIETIDKHIEDNEILMNKYKLKLELLRNSNKIINALNTKVDEITRQNKNEQTSSEEKIQEMNASIESTINDYIKLLNCEHKLKESKINVEEKEIIVASNEIGNYIFKLQPNIDKINLDLFNRLIKLLLDGRTKIDLMKLDAEKLKKNLKGYGEQKKNEIDVYSYFEQEFNKKLEQTFKTKSIIVSKDNEYDKNGKSVGYDTKVYFNLICSNDDNGIYIVDQPEDDLSQKSITDYVLKDFKTMSKSRQVMLVTHNPQFLINLDVDNVIYLYRNSSGDLDIKYGALEYEDNNTNILKIIADNIDGGIETINRRWKRYDKTFKNE